MIDTGVWLLYKFGIGGSGIDHIGYCKFRVWRDLWHPAYITLSAQNSHIEWL